MFPNVLALDFDGVLCDGMQEYFETSWRTYGEIWHPSNLEPPNNLRDRFIRLRPVIEIGWEMPLLIRALILDIPETDIEQNWATIAKELLQTENLNAVDIGSKLDRIRDRWIASDLDSWLALHRFYLGVVERLQELLASEVQPIIITTKEGRFVRQLLQQQSIDLPVQWIIGKEVKRSKSQTLRELLGNASDRSPTIWFVEDRLKTLESIKQQPDLNSVQLFLADWGYNTAQMRESIRGDRRIRLLSLSQFSQDFSTWY
jgi:phosphoglycolate phosphatase-like HAD superfamily hydrolase